MNASQTSLSRHRGDLISSCAHDCELCATVHGRLADKLSAESWVNPTDVGLQDPDDTNDAVGVQFGRRVDRNATSTKP